MRVSRYLYERACEAFMKMDFLDEKILFDFVIIVNFN